MKKLYVSNKDQSAQMFESSFLELFSKVHWTVPLFLFVPAVFYFLYQGWQSAALSLLTLLGWVIGGIFIWTIIEYVLHRFVFHYQPPGELGAKLHFIFHGVHHDYPNDSMRLVMPPVVSIPLATLFYYLFSYLIPTAAFYPFFAGFLIGYLFYDMLHYAIHHAPMKGKLWMALKTHHLKHHFKDPDNGYGVSSPIWDIIVGTQFKKGRGKRN